MLEILSNVLGVFWNIKLVHTKLMEEATYNEKIITIIRKNRDK